MEKKFGVTTKGEEVTCYTIENKNFLVSVCDYGATLVSLVVKEKGIDVVQGFDSVDGYESQVQYMGQTIGRVCNRIGKGQFELNGIHYQVPINNNGNSLHGGINGFDRQVWSCEVLENKIICKYVSKDKEEGYPGNVEMKVSYILEEDGLLYDVEAISDQDTLLNVTNHAFFNLCGPTSETVLNHQVKINAQTFACVDENGCTHEEVRNVKNTAFDFTDFKELGKNINDEDIQLVNGSGYDHHYLVDGDGFREFLICKTDEITMTVLSDLPGFHMYTSNFLEGNSKGKEGGIFPRRSAVCFETQYYPNAIQTKNQQKPILKKGDLWHHQTKFKFTI